MLVRRRQQPDLRLSADAVSGTLQNLQVANFPGNALAAKGFSGEFRGYDIFAGSSAGNCVDLENTQNPYRFYGLVASGCATGINLDKTKSEEFHGVSVFGNSIDVSVTGTKPLAQSYILFDGAQFQNSGQENMYLDQQNETVLCAANCEFRDAGKNCSRAPPADCFAAIVIGPDARTNATGATPIIAQFNQGVFNAAQPDVQFDQNANGKYCKCYVALGGGMYDVATQDGTGIPTTNNPALLAGQTSYAPPTFANAASVGPPLNLAPTEFGISTSSKSQSVTQPGTGGLKFRVECNSDGTAKLVALAGTSNSETVVANEIGGGVSCPN